MMATPLVINLEEREKCGVATSFIAYSDVFYKVAQETHLAFMMFPP